MMMSSLPLPYLPFLLLGLLLAVAVTLSDASRPMSEEKPSFTGTVKTSLMQEASSPTMPVLQQQKKMMQTNNLKILPHFGHKPGHPRYPPQQGLLSTDTDRARISTANMSTTSYYDKPSLPLFKAPNSEKASLKHLPVAAAMKPGPKLKLLPEAHYKKPRTSLHRPLYKLKPPSATRIHHL